MDRQWAAVEVVLVEVAEAVVQALAEVAEPELVLVVEKEPAATHAVIMRQSRGGPLSLAQLNKAPRRAHC